MSLFCLKFFLWKKRHPEYFIENAIPRAFEFCCYTDVQRFRYKYHPFRVLRVSKNGCTKCHRRDPEEACCRWNKGITSHAEGYFVPNWLKQQLSAKKKKILFTALGEHSAELKLVKLPPIGEGAITFEKFKELEVFAWEFLAKVFSGELGRLLPPHFKLIVYETHP